MDYTNRNFTWDFDALKRFYEKYVVRWLNSAVSWTEAQKKQARANLGFGDGDAVVYTEDYEYADLNIADDNNNVIAQFKDGHIKTKNFDSSIVPHTTDTNVADFTVCDEDKKILVMFADGHIKTKNFDSSTILTFDDLMDYQKVLKMPHDSVKSFIEIVSGNQCTVLYDDDGYPSLMYKIPKVSIGSLAPTLGELTDIHPAFVVNGVEKDYIYAGVFLTSLYNGHYVSWFGLPPQGRIIVPTLRTDIANKGDGWHLETIYERSLITLLAMHLNSANPTGNTKRGISHTNPWEYCEMKDGSIPGSKTTGTGIQWINGTQPTAWSHNKQKWGIYDVIGGYHEICDLYKLVNGKIYISSDNKFFSKEDDIATFENTWLDTGAAFDLQGTNLDNVLHTSVTYPFPRDTYKQNDYSEVRCSESYDELPVAIRKKLSLLLLAPRLTSADADTVFPIQGKFCINNNKSLCYGVFGGSEEYDTSGLGANVTAYPIDDNAVEGHNAHSNMGSRMFYIA